MHLMIDIETLGVTPGAVIVEVGAVLFNKEGIEERVQIYLNKKEQFNNGLITEPATLEFWKQNLRNSEFNSLERVNAERALDVKSSNGASVKEVRKELERLVQCVDEFVWCKGAGFDYPILSYYFRAMKSNNPLNLVYGRTLCYRTYEALLMKKLTPEKNGKYIIWKKENTNEHPHSAIWDAEYQAKEFNYLTHLSGF